MHQNENSWPKLNKMKHWAEGRIPSTVFSQFFTHVFCRFFHHCINIWARHVIVRYNLFCLFAYSAEHLNIYFCYFRPNNFGCRTFGESLVPTTQLCCLQIFIGSFILGNTESLNYVANDRTWDRSWLTMLLRSTPLGSWIWCTTLPLCIIYRAVWKSVDQRPVKLQIAGFNGY